MLDKFDKKIKEYFKNNIFTKENKLILIITFIVGLITHFYLYANELLNPDLLISGAVYTATNYEICLGRWGLYFIDLLTCGITNYLLVTIMCLFLCSLTTMLIIKMLKIKNPIIITLISSLIVSSPQFAETLFYPYAADAYILSMLLSTLFVYFVYKKESKITNYIFASICLILSLSLYQSYVAFSATLCVILTILKILEGHDTKSVILQILKAFITGFISCIIYYFITVIILKINNLSFSEYCEASSILKYPFMTYINGIKESYNLTYYYYFNDYITNNISFGRHIINIIIFLLIIYSIVLIVIKNKIYRNITKIILLVMLIITFPIALNIIHIIAPAKALLLIIILQYILIYILSLKLADILNRNILLKYLIYIFTSILIFTYILSNNASYMYRQEVFNNYYDTTSRMLDRVFENEYYYDGMPILFAGNIENPSSRLEPYINKSAFSFNMVGYNDYRTATDILFFIDRYMGKEITTCSYEDYLNIISSDIFKEMDVFPADDSVKIIDGIMVVKIDYNPPTN